MRIAYAYNEILPKRAAHDVYLFHNVLSLAEAGFDVGLLLGRGGMGDSDLFCHYGVGEEPRLSIHRLPILRKNKIFSLSWNGVFHYFTQRFVVKKRPERLILSVLKQGAYHFQRRVSGVKYVYEAHQIAWYPGDSLREKKEAIEFEKKVFENADLVTVTTAALRSILLAEPYALKTRVEIVPLAVHAQPLPNVLMSEEALRVMYVGQLYAGQGVELLLEALKRVPGVVLDLVGGKENEVDAFKKQAKVLEIADRVVFHGFCSPHLLPSVVERADAFVAPFEKSGRMPYVAHTKLLEYAEWGRPVVASDLPVVQEHFPEGKGALLFSPGDPEALAACLVRLQDAQVRQKLQREAACYAGQFSWKKRANRYKDLLQNL
ncbi:glycosyltransferase family 4 protein [Simkania negevensis]|uniref:Glycosyltransferase family 4 protein n=1 Tax=Simkania negevensis TaxID=83561 RepID=A0ABS3ASQ0_9BACT|nr:glycosyltransferase family 4 protein [Simkania negevensis]